MKISGFTYIRNGLEYDYPFLESIRSVLPVCDEVIIAVGDSHDGTRQAIEKIGDPKIRIIDTVWDDKLRTGGKIFAQQANIALEQISGDWGVHLQADEVFHEKDLDTIRKAMEENYSNPNVEGLLFPFINFWGSYDYIRTTRWIHRYEIRAFKTNKTIRSYKDSQGFRKYLSLEAFKQGKPGAKLRVKMIDAPVYHYNYVHHPEKMKKKSNYFNRFWHDDNWLDKKNDKQKHFEYNNVDKLEKFKGVHPEIIKERVQKQDWEFHYDPQKTKFSPKDAILYKIEKITGWRIGEYKNYKRIR